jgi:hypothetical protein
MEFRDEPRADKYKGTANDSPAVRLRHLYVTYGMVQLGDDELASGDWREGEVLFPL